VPLASWIIPAHYRPHLLGAALRSIYGQLLVPSAWRQEVIVVHMRDDLASAEIAAGFGAALVSTDLPFAGAKRTLGFRHSQGDLLLVGDDDDLQSPVFLAAAVAAYEAGHPITAVREFRYVELPSGRCARWSGHHKYGPEAGYHRTYARGVLDDIGGWVEASRGVDTLTHRKIIATGRWPLEHDISQVELGGLRIADTMLNLQHGANIWRREFPPLGRSAMWGQWGLRGEGLIGAAVPPPAAAHWPLLAPLLAA